jgi:hypothetical protein
MAEVSRDYLEWLSGTNLDEDLAYTLAMQHQYPFGNFARIKPLDYASIPSCRQRNSV